MQSTQRRGKAEEGLFKRTAEGEDSKEKKKTRKSLESVKGQEMVVKEAGREEEGAEGGGKKVKGETEKGEDNKRVKGIEGRVRIKGE